MSVKSNGTTPTTGDNGLKIVSSEYKPAERLRKAPETYLPLSMWTMYAPLLREVEMPKGILEWYPPEQILEKKQ